MSWKPVNPESMADPVGYANAIETEGGRRLFIAGQVDMAKDGSVANPGDLVAQVEGTFRNIITVLEEAGGKPEHIVRMRIYVADVEDYKSHGKAIGAIYREHFGRWFPAMTLIQVSRFYDPDALIEVETDAVIP